VQRRHVAVVVAERVHDLLEPVERHLRRSAQHGLVLHELCTPQIAQVSECQAESILHEETEKRRLHSR